LEGDFTNNLCVAEGGVMRKDVLQDELRQVGYDLVEGERQLAEQEALLVAHRQENKDVSKLEAALEQIVRRQMI
jgi:hypothetical protein